MTRPNGTPPSRLYALAVERRSTFTLNHIP
jgi:hypothetical protein